MPVGLYSYVYGALQPNQLFPFIAADPPRLDQALYLVDTAARGVFSKQILDGESMDLRHAI